jgi:hypothetical protein
MKIRIELSGVAKAITGENPIFVEIQNSGTYKDLIKNLADRYPSLVGIIISPNRDELLNANIFSKSGEDLILGEALLGRPVEGEKIFLLSVIVGG